MVEFFLETRLEPEIAAACKKMDTKTGRYLARVPRQG